MQLMPDLPVGRPSFDLADDQLAIIVDLLCQGAALARNQLTSGMLEVPITILVKKAMRKLKRQLSLTNLQITGEHELLDSHNEDPAVAGRIDITFQFLHQFGDEEAYVGVECKRVANGVPDLNSRYVTQGVSRFATGKYGAGHPWGLMLGYVIKLPTTQLVAAIDTRIRKDYGETARLEIADPHAQSLAIWTSALIQGRATHIIKLMHIFVDMTPAT
jgi:hypothetical protein